MFTDRDHKFFETALALAETSTHYKSKIGAILVYKKQIISVGVNGYKTHPVQMRYNSFRNMEDESMCSHRIHAEIDCVLKAERLFGEIPKKCKLYVARIWKTGKIGYCRPCPGCSRYLLTRGIKDWYYTTNDGYAYEQVNL